jgi:hypothetical protein
MEIGLDFGFFELIAATALAWTARFVFKRRWLTIAFLVWSIAAPIALLFLVEGERLRWLVVACVAPAAIHVATMILLMRRYDLGELLGKKPIEQHDSRAG